MQRQANCRFGNITQEHILLYFQCCQFCETKQQRVKKGIVVKPIIIKDAFSRLQCDYIDLQSCPDVTNSGSKKFILHVQDHLTKFAFLKATENKTAETTAKNIEEVIDIIGAPTILHTDNGREFCNEVLYILLNKYGVKMINEKPRHSQGSVERGNKDVQDIIQAWQLENNSSSWSSCLGDIQFQKNTRFHRGIDRSPYQAFLDHSTSEWTELASLSYSKFYLLSVYIFFPIFEKSSSKFHYLHLKKYECCRKGSLEPLSGTMKYNLYFFPSFEL